MGRPRIDDLQTGFAGGLNTSADSSQLRSDEVRRAENARLTEFGGVEKRGGTQRMHASALGSIHGGFAWMQPSTSYHFVAEGAAISVSPLGSAPLTWTPLVGAIDANALVDFAAFRDGSGEIVYIADGGPLNKASNTTLTVNIASTSNSSSICVHNQRLYGVDGTTPNLFISAINNGDTLGNTGSGGVQAVIRTFGGGANIAVRSLGSSLAVFHKAGISRVTGLTVDDIDIDAGQEGYSQQVGAIAKQSLITIEREIFFMAEQGFFRLSETGIESISLKIDNSIRNIGADVISRVVGFHDKLRHEVCWYIPDVGVYAYNLVLKSWSGPWNGIYKTSGVRAMWSTSANGTLPSQTFIGSTDGYVRLCDTDNANDDVLSDGTGGVRPQKIVQCHRMFFGDEATEKSLRWCYAMGDLRGSQNAYARWRSGTGTSQKDIGSDGATGTEWGAGTWGQGEWGGSGTSIARMQGSQRGPYFDFFIYDDGPGRTLFSRIRLTAFDMTRR